MQVADLYKSSNLESILKSENFDNFDLSLFSQEDFSTKNKAGKTVNYVSCHDNYTLFDQIDLSSKKSKDSKIDQVEQAQAMVFFSEGISFIHGGEEFLRTKQNGTSSQVHNSYNAGDEVNKFDYARKIENLNTYNFMKEAISIRNSFNSISIFYLRNFIFQTISPHILFIH